MTITRSLMISASGLSAERARMETIANNIANINTTREADGQPFRRKHVVLAAGSVSEQSFGSILLRMSDNTPDGVRVVGKSDDQAPFKKVHDPGHPDADPNGDVLMPNIEPVMEMVDMISAQRSYEAGISAIGAAKSMQRKALEIGKA